MHHVLHSKIYLKNTEMPCRISFDTLKRKTDCHYIHFIAELASRVVLLQTSTKQHNQCASLWATQCHSFLRITSYKPHVFSPANSTKPKFSKKHDYRQDGFYTLVQLLVMWPDLLKSIMTSANKVFKNTMKCTVTTFILLSRFLVICIAWKICVSGII